MLQIGVLGIGNAGGQVAALASVAGFDALALNSSEKDLRTIEKDVPGIIIGDEKGAGKDRTTAKNFIRKKAAEFINSDEMKIITSDKDIMVIVSSTGGGTGSGMAPVLHAVLQKAYPKVHFIIASIIPMLEESLAEQQNSAEYLTEMLKTDPTYMVYDNSSTSGTTNKTEAMIKINKKIVDDLRVMRGDYQFSTPFTSIDETDAMRMFSTRGRLVIEHIEKFKEKDIDTKSIAARVLESIRNSGAAELEADRSVKRLGIIYNLNDKLYKTFDQNEIHEYIGTPLEGFEHIRISDAEVNSLSLIAAGLSFPDDRIEKIAQRIEELRSTVTRTKGSRVLASIETAEINELRIEDEVRTDLISNDDIKEADGDTLDMDALAALMADY